MPMDIINQVQWPNLIAGIGGGLVSTLVLHPLDLVKIRLQVNERTGAVKYRPNSSGTIQTLVDLVRARGLPGLYLGLTPNIVGTSVSWGLYFFFYSTMKRRAQENDPTRVLTTLHYLTFSAVAGTIALTMMNPIWVMKTRLCLQYESLHPSGEFHSKPIPKTGTNRLGLWKALVNLWRTEGIVGFYRGYVPGLLGVSHGALQFMLYEHMCNLYKLHYKEETIDQKLNSLEYLTFASSSKLIAATATYPYQVLRSRLQDQHRQYSGIIEVIKVLWKGEGFLGLYKGLVPNLFRVVPSCAITFLVYERTLQFLTTKS